jgi:hypothetical protein
VTCVIVVTLATFGFYPAALFWRSAMMTGIVQSRAVERTLELLGYTLRNGC